MSPTINPLLEDNPPKDEQPDDSDRDFDVKNADHLHYFIAKLRKARTLTRQAHEQANQLVLKVQREEGALSHSYGSYLSGVADWREQKARSGDIRKPWGTLLWGEETEKLKITDQVAMERLLHTHVQAPLALDVALHLSNKIGPSLSSSSTERKQFQRTPSIVDLPHGNVPPVETPLSQAVQVFYEATQILPAGCSIRAPNRVVPLE